jgi:O-antigen biosynthesis protein
VTHSSDKELVLDPDWYRKEYPFVDLLGMTPEVHFARFGSRIGLRPNQAAQSESHRNDIGFSAQPNENPKVSSLEGLGYQYSLETSQGKRDAEYVGEEVIPSEYPVFDVRTIAFYLPQFHPIPENDLWWGKGFTEWTNVSKAVPQYVGQYQPHLPGELGFYDLRVKDVQKRQSELAQSFGLAGFCFYFYWFGGKTLLEDPIKSWSDNEEAALPFCLCWANENWSRRWDGLNEDVLIAQDHSDEDDLRFIRHISQYLRNDKYIKIDGRPLLIVYRPSLLPDATATVARLRTWCLENGVGEIHVSVVQSFDMMNPNEIGFDSAIEFPPMNMGPPDITSEIVKVNPNFSGTVYSYDFYLDRTNNFPSRDYTIFRGVFPSWDNEARRTGKGTSFFGAAPSKFKTYVENTAREALKAKSPDNRLMFVNAWNEWAEGAHLEPDQRYGYAWLSALHDGLAAAGSASVREKLILVVHDGYRHGAQYLALSMARVFSRELNFDLEIIILGHGPLKPDFEQYGTVHDLAGIDQAGSIATALAKTLFENGARAAICNTTVTGLFLETLSNAGIDCVALIHELPKVIAQYNLDTHLEAIWKHAKLTVYPSKFIMEQLSHSESSAAIIRTQGLYKTNYSIEPSKLASARERLRKHFGLPPETEIVLSVAHGDKRKGIDLWVSIGQRVIKKRPNAVFIWVGDIDEATLFDLKSDISAHGMEHAFLFPMFQSQTDDFYAGSDVYALTSREDPFPSVILESMEVGVPVVAFDGAGGFNALFERGIGNLVPMEDCVAFSDSLVALLEDHQKRFDMAKRAREIIKSDYSFRKYCFDLAAYAGTRLKRVSVVVPTYNYAEFMLARLNSIINQGYPIYEIIVLDDCSSDNTLEVTRQWLEKSSIDWVLEENKVNSGSPCKQWSKGAKMSTGDFVWIAEADDLTLPGFLDETLKPFDVQNVVLSYCQSQQMSSDGRILCRDYIDYTADIDPHKWQEDYLAPGFDEIRSVLAVKNTIPNVSAVVFRRDVLVDALEGGLEFIGKFRVAGDWATYVRVLERGSIAFSAKSLNLHRRHQGSITLGSFNEKQLHEILTMQQSIREGVGVTKQADEIARKYAQKLFDQFGLSTDMDPSVFSSPSFRSYFQHN